MYFRFLTVLTLFVLVSCGSKSALTHATKLPVKISKSKLTERNASTSFKTANFNTVKINSKMSYEIGKSSHKLGLKLRVAKGEKIWMSADFLGFPVAKILIQRDSVMYYNKIDKTYFKGSFDLIKELVGVDISYGVLENMLMGDTSINLNKGAYKLSREEGFYSFKNSGAKKYLTTVEVYPVTYKIKSQSIVHHGGDNSFRSFYKNHQLIDDFLFPKDVEIKAGNKEKKSIISMSYTSVTFNEKLTFPFKIPKECDKEIILNSEKKKNN